MAEPTVMSCNICSFGSQFIKMYLLLFFSPLWLSWWIMRFDHYLAQNSIEFGAIREVCSLLGVAVMTLFFFLHIWVLLVKSNHSRNFKQLRVHWYDMLLILCVKALSSCWHMYARLFRKILMKWYFNLFLIFIVCPLVVINSREYWDLEQIDGIRHRSKYMKNKAGDLSYYITCSFEGETKKWK